MCIPIPGWKVVDAKINPPDLNAGGRILPWNLIQSKSGVKSEDRVI
jgi:hypothetical protein